MEADSPPESLHCAECGEAVEDTGYVPARGNGGTDDLLSEDAVCGDCGFNAIGMSGCAPELDDLGASDEADVLLYVRRTDEGFDVVSTKE